MFPFVRRNIESLPGNTSITVVYTSLIRNNLPRAVCHANQSARTAMRVAVMPKEICRMLSSSIDVCMP
jgi:hypothetical protein